MLDFLPIPNLDHETLTRLGVFAIAAVVLTVLLFFGIRAIAYRVRNRERLQYEKLYGKGNYPEDILHDVGGCIQYYKPTLMKRTGLKCIYLSRVAEGRAN